MCLVAVIVSLNIHRTIGIYNNSRISVHRRYYVIFLIPPPLHATRFCHLYCFNSSSSTSTEWSSYLETHHTVLHNTAFCITRSIAARILQQEEGPSRMSGAISETCKSSFLRFWRRGIPYTIYYQSRADQIWAALRG